MDAKVREKGNGSAKRNAKVALHVQEEGLQAFSLVMWNVGHRQGNGSPRDYFDKVY